MGKLRGFMDYPRCDPAYRPTAERLRDFRAVETPLADDEIGRQAARCMDCGVPFCHGCGCPLGNVVPEWNDLVHQQRWKEALDLLLAYSPFPEFTTRVCPALCEGACVLGINDQPVSIRQIELAIVEKGFELGYIQPAPPRERKAQRVAVIGSGPAGLAAADALNRAGYTVVVYDEAASPGGILRYGIPDFKLEKWIVERRIALMRAEGVVFESGVRVGDDVSIHYLQNRFQALCFCIGSRIPRDLPVPGRDLKGIHFALEFLTQQNQRLASEPIDPSRAITAQGRQVVVIGGGDTGSDCLGTALRQGAAQVRQYEILPQPPPVRAPSNPWPQWPLILRHSSSHKEGGERRWCVSIRAFTGQSGHVCKVSGVEVEWSTPAPGQPPVMTEKPGTAFEAPADLVLIAMGFTGPRRIPVLEELGVQFDRNNRAIRNPTNGMTNLRGVFVAGDVATGASLVVRAITDGRQCADDIIRWFSEST